MSNSLIKYFDTISSRQKFLTTIIIVLIISLVICSISSIVLYQRGLSLLSNRVYVLDKGGRAISVSLSNNEIDRSIEIKDHSKRFHEYLFNLSPDSEAIENSINKALNMGDKSIYEYYSDQAEKGFYRRLITANISQDIRCDSILIKDNYPYEIDFFGKVYLTRESNISALKFHSNCFMRDIQRSENNPHGLMIEKNNRLIHASEVKEAYDVPLLLWHSKMDSSMYIDAIRTSQDFLHLFTEILGVKTENVKRNYQFISEDENDEETITILKGYNDDKATPYPYKKLKSNAFSLNE